MSVLKKFIQVIFVTAIIVLFLFLNKLDAEGPPGGKHILGEHKEPFLETLAWSSLSHDKSSKGAQKPFDSAASSLSSHFRPGILKPLGSTYSRAIVVPRLRTDNVSWILDELPGTDTVVYTVNDPLATLHPPKNKGHEVMIYLSYIIDHYDTLPDIIVFMHAHRWTHHNNALLAYDAVEMVRRLNSDYVTREGYVNMRCHWSPGCPEWLHSGESRESLEKQEEIVLSKSWNELFPLEPLPVALGQACCAQFALSKERVLSVPLGRFIFYRDWITRTPLSDYVSGRIWEYSWQFLFTGQSIYCPAEHVCHCGGFGLCFGGASEFQEFEELRQKKEHFEMERNALGGQRDQRSNASALRYDYLNDQIARSEQDIALREQKARERGLDPGNRAKECGARWDKTGIHGSANINA